MNNRKKLNILFVINPFSGTSKKGNLVSSINLHLDTNKYDYQIVYTEYAGHAAQLAAKNADEFYMIVAVGGDGTVNEIAGQLAHKETILGIIPGGSGNGFSMHLGIGRNLIKAIKILNTGQPKWVDTCKMNDHFFINVAGMGFDAKIAYLTKLNAKRGFMNYFKTSMQEAQNFQSELLEITIDGITTKGKYAAAVVANASMYGYHFTIAPTAALDDGLLDIMLIKEAPKYRYFLMAPRFLNRSLHRSSLTETYTGKNITISASRPIYAHVDGEGLDVESNYHFSISPKSLQIMTPFLSGE